MADLKAKGKEQTRKIYARRGVPHDRMSGVSIADLEGIAKTIKKERDLACELFRTGGLDAMCLAVMVADGKWRALTRALRWMRSTAPRIAFAAP